MDEDDDSIQLELTTDREIVVAMHAMAIGGAFLVEHNHISGAQAASNLQIRLASDNPERVKSALDMHAEGGMMTDLGEMSNEAAIGALVEEEEVDPDEATEGML